MKTLRLAAAAALLAAALHAGAEGKEPLKVGALLAVTGPASFLGAPEARTLEMLVDELNANGGVDGRRIELVVKDTGGDPAKAVSFAKQLIEEDKVFAIVGPATSGETIAVKPIAEEAKTLLLSCAAAEVIVNPVLAHVFKVAPKDSFAAEMIFRRMKKMGVKRIGFLSSNTGFGKAGKEQVEKLAPAHGIEIAVSEVYAKAAVAAAEGVIFPASRIVVAEGLPEKHPQKTVVAAYKKGYEVRYKEDVSTFGGHAHDALMILARAVKDAGLDREQVRAAVENMKGFVGTAGVFNFSPADHNGLALDAFEMITVKDGKFAVLGE